MEGTSVYIAYHGVTESEKSRTTWSEENKEL